MSDPRKSSRSDVPVMEGLPSLSEVASKIVREQTEELVPRLVQKHSNILKEALFEELLERFTTDEIAEAIEEKYPRRSYFGTQPVIDGQLRADLASGASNQGSSLVGFTPSGSGTSRNVQAKLREIEVSITDYGATTSATAAINAAAIQEAHDDGLPSTGGTIKVPGAASAYTVALESVSFTKPVLIKGDGKDASILTFTGNASNADGINTTKSLFLDGVTLQVTTAPTTNLTMKGIQLNNPATSGHWVEVNNSAILDFNIGVFVDGRSAGLANFDVDRVVVSKSKIRIAAANGDASCEPVFIAGTKQAIVEENDLDNNSDGDHNVYMIGVQNISIQKNKLSNAPNEAFKLISQGAALSGDYGVWSVKGNEIFNCGRAGVIQPTGSIVIPVVELEGNEYKTVTSTTGADEAAIYVAPADTSIIRLLKVNGEVMNDVQLGGYVMSCASGAEITLAKFDAITVKNFGQATSDTYSGIASGSAGTIREVVVDGVIADGNSTGRGAIELESVQTLVTTGIKEINCVTPNPCLLETQKVTLFDDFLGDVIADQWNTSVGSDGQCVAARITSWFRGLITLTTGDDAGATMALNGSQLDHALNWAANQERLVFEARVAISAITDVVVFVGLTDQVAALEMPFTYSGTTLTSNATDACGVLFDTDATTDNWKFVGVANNTDATVQDAGVAPSGGTMETWRIDISKTGVATFYRNGKSIGSAMTGAVTASVRLTPVIAAFSRGAATRNIECDYVFVQADR